MSLHAANAWERAAVVALRIIGAALGDHRVLTRQRGRRRAELEDVKRALPVVAIRSAPA